ncbi:sister chromatid cohesion C-terminus-domain-containing protein [Pisolithus marmoratus]|nr:sister chromatid cohesion C-terminus-domain-containing protein [Pisolithus marmoratus]
MSNLSIVEPPPTYMHANQNNPYVAQYQSYHQPASPFAGYSNELAYLSNPSVPASHSAYWQATRDESVKLLSYGPPMNQSGYVPPPAQWSRNTPSSTFQPPALANSLLQRFNPTSAYPTPPPPGIRASSSSLAFALGNPNKKPSERVYKPQESGPFVKDFLNRSAQLIESKPIPPAPAMPCKDTLSIDSRPHPPNPPLLPLAEASTTPRKRKSPEDISTPSPKRIQTCTSERSTPSVMTINTTPSKESKTPRHVLAYVNVPPPSWRTPSGKQLKPGERAGSDYSEDDDEYRHGAQSSVKLSARRTGDRDERAPLEKLTTLIEDIFEAEDSLPVDIQAADLPKEFFRRSQLQHNLIRKLTKYISQLAHPPKRTRRPAREIVQNSHGAKSRETLGDIESPILSRLMKVLERTIKAGEDLDPFRTSLPLPTDKSLKHSAMDGAGNEDGGAHRDTSQVSSHQHLTDSDVRTLAAQLEIARDSILAAECCIALLSGEGLTKQLYSEELITTCLSTIKNQLTMIVYPFVEGSGVGTSTSPQLQCLHRYTHSGTGDLRRLLGELFQALSAALPRVNSLFSADGLIMSDAIIIQTVYVAIGPFFVVESALEGDAKGKKENAVLSTLGSSAMRGLRLDVLSIIRSIFANHEDQRSWIIEEILTSLIKLSNSHKKAGQFRLRDGRSIRTVSALLLQLVQTSARDVRVAARKIAKSRHNHALRRQDSSHDTAQDAIFDEHDTREIQLYMSGLESATTAAKTIILFLTQRSGKGKQTKNSNEAEYRIILDNLISDLLVVLYWPEWPAASLILSVICKFMVSSLDDVKTSQQADTNAAKTIALDHLGVIAARLRTSALRVRQRSRKHPALPLDEIVSSESVENFERLLARHEAISSHLLKRSSDDQAYESARELTAALWGHELATALRALQNTLHNEDKGVNSRDQSTAVFCARLQKALSSVWQDHSNDIFDVGSQEEAARADLLAEEIGTVQGLMNSFGPILNVVLMALDAPPVFMRTKALRALGQIVTSDSTILSTTNVRRAIESHLLDSSPAVRDAAVELIGRYMIESPEVAGDYYSKIADRIADTGLGVRKRVIKLLKQYYGVTDDMNRRIDISTKLVLRILDEDETVKDLAVKTIEELWFQISVPQVSPSKSRLHSTPTQLQDKTALLSKVSVIMGVSAFFKDRQSPLEDVLHKIIANQTATELPLMHAKYSEVCEALIDGLVDASDLPGFTVQSCVRTLYLFATAHPSVLSGSNASTLLPYLKNPTSTDELVVSDYLLRVFRISIPHMPKTAVKFGQDLQLVLQPMIVKPSNVGGVVCLQESVACMCGSVQHLTHDFHRLVALLKSCNARLQQAISRKTETMTQVEIRTLSILIFIVALLGEHCDFDKLRAERTEFASELNSVSEGPTVEHIYSSLLALYARHTDSGLKGRILQCLGFLFRARPTLMTLDQSAGIMDAIFASPDEESRGRLLRILQDFLVSEAAKHAEQQKGSGQVRNEGGVDMAHLVGNTDDFADSGVSSAVVQRYLTHILDAALSPNPQIQTAAMEILSFTVKQGLAHPLQSIPVIVALETSPVIGTSARASTLHAILYSKHMSLLNARFIVSAKQSFEYQKTISPNNVQGYRMQPEPTAHLQRWYSLVREKRTPRQDFLKALVKSFDIPPTLKSTQNDIDFVRYMAENFATLDYKTQEEVLTVIKHLTSILSTSGMQIIDVVSPSHLLAQLHEAQPQSHPDGTTASMPLSTPDVDVDIMRTSVIIGIVMLLKTYLKTLYGLSEEKCSKFVPGKKSAIGDKPATKRHPHPISWDRLPFATMPLILPEDLVKHRTTFLHVWNEDGVAPEPEDAVD